MAVDSAEQVGPVLRNPDVLYKRSCWRAYIVYKDSRWCSRIHYRTVVKEMEASREKEGRLLSKRAVQFGLADFALLKRPRERQRITGIKSRITEQGGHVAPVTAVSALPGGNLQPPLAGPAEFARIRILVHGNTFHARGRQIEGASLHPIHNDRRSASADNGRVKKQRGNGQWVVVFRWQIHNRMLVELNLVAILFCEGDGLSTNNHLLRNLRNFELHPNVGYRSRADSDGPFHRLETGNVHAQDIVSRRDFRKFKSTLLVRCRGKGLPSGRGGQINIGFRDSSAVGVSDDSPHRPCVLSTRC